VEIDPVLVRELGSAFSREIGTGSLHLIEGDAVEVDLPPVDLVVSNLPYSVSSPVTFRLLELGFSEAVLMYQAEFADRMTARVGSPACGRLTVMVQTFADVERCFNVPPGAFTPRPRSASTPPWSGSSPGRRPIPSGTGGTTRTWSGFSSRSGARR